MKNWIGLGLVFLVGLGVVGCGQIEELVEVEREEQVVSKAWPTLSESMEVAELETELDAVEVDTVGGGLVELGDEIDRL